MSSRRTRRIQAQVSTFTAGRLPADQVTTESQRLNRKRRAVLAKAKQAEQRGSQFEAAMYNREAAKLNGALEKAQGGGQEPTTDVLTARCNWDFRWVRQGGEMHYKKCGV